MARKPKAGAGEPARPEPATGLLSLGQARLEGNAPESAEERAFRMALARELMATPEEKLAEARTLFERLCRMMGEDEARKQWQAIAKRRGGRPRGSTNPAHNAKIARVIEKVGTDFPNKRHKIVPEFANFLTEKELGKRSIRNAIRYDARVKAWEKNIRRVMTRSAQA